MPKLTAATLLKASLALMMLAAGLATAFGYDRMGARFDALGASDAMRVVAGLVQVLAAVALMAPGRAAYGAALANDGHVDALEAERVERELGDVIRVATRALNTLRQARA